MDARKRAWHAINVYVFRSRQLARFSIDMRRFRQLARFVARRVGEDRIPQVAGSLTFTTVLAVVPLATVAFAAFTAFPIFGSFQAALQSFMADHLMPAQINRQVMEYLNTFASKARGLTTAGLVVLLMTSIATMMTVESALNVIWRVRKARSMAQRMLVYWAFLSLGPLLFGMSLSISSYLLSRSLWLTGARALPPFIEWALAGASVPVTALGFTLLYAWLPSSRVEWRDALSGGVFAALAFEGAKRGFGLYIRQFPAYAAVYGTFAAVPIFLLWLYLSWFITLIGGMIAANLPAVRHGYFHRPAFPGSDLLDALHLLAALAVARERGAPGRTFGEIVADVHRDPDTVRRVLDVLATTPWLLRAQPERGPIRWLLVANPRQVTLAALFDLFVVDRAALVDRMRDDTSRVDGALLAGALENERLRLTLDELLTARSHAHDARGAAVQAIAPGHARA
jgi:membrane protein